MPLLFINETDTSSVVYETSVALIGGKPFLELRLCGVPVIRIDSDTGEVVIVQFTGDEKVTLQNAGFMVDGLKLAVR